MDADREVERENGTICGGLRFSFPSLVDSINRFMSPTSPREWHINNDSGIIGRHSAGDRYAGFRVRDILVRNVWVGIKRLDGGPKELCDLISGYRNNMSFEIPINQYICYSASLPDKVKQD